MILSFAVLLLLAGGDEPAIRKILEEQVAAWNRGDIAGFMQTYDNSPNVTFVGGRGLTRGWQPVMERYKKSYPDKGAMGTLTFSELETTTLGAGHAMAIGRWQLQRDKDRPGGYFTLILKKGRAGWRIVHDHSSAVAP